MAQRHRFSNNRQKAKHAAAQAPMMRQPIVLERKAVVVYGKPFIMMEDEQKQTFVYKSAGWVPHTMSVAECRKSCLVKELPQKVNRMTRYEVRSPVSVD